ncbi:muconolactone Delta-isomerase [Gemmatimonas sp.]|uniref:muconolactone Delta-isomerase n=1 Tax=Gemmatimonas sp. TaxID=1962908 RepID=UPI003562C054
MEFMVLIENTYPLDGDPDERGRLFEAEAARVRDLASHGTLVKLWRRSGTRINVSVWRVSSVEQLHEEIASLPCYPWLRPTVWPLSAHPNDPSVLSEGIHA